MKKKKYRQGRYSILRKKNVDSVKQNSTIQFFTITIAWSVS